ncbi:MAG: alpha/beta hydrolase [Bacteroidota bacterium]
MRYRLPSGQGKLAISSHFISPDVPTLIFLHDSLGCIKLWRDFPKQLTKATHTNYLIYDRLGYGQASRFPALAQRANNYLEEEADILTKLIEDLKIKKSILFGHSDGGSIALIAAGKRPDLIKGLISEGAHVFVEDITLAGIKAAEVQYKETPLREKLMKYHGDKVDEVFFAWTEVWQRPSFRDWNIEHFLPSIICPLLIIQGKEDEFGSLKQVASIYQQVEGIAEKFIPANAKHSPHREAPELTLKRCTSFIQENLRDPK